MSAPPRPALIEVEGFTKRYGGEATAVEVLRDVSFGIERAEFVAIVGPSGSGKTTLMNLLGFLDRPDAGVYRFDGRDLSGADDAELSAIRNREIGFVFQQFHLLDRSTAIENVVLPFLYSDDAVSDADARARAALEQVGLGDRAQRRPGELSGGEQQRVAIARAVVTGPALILADEPTGNLDQQTGMEILELLEGLRAGGRTVVLITHDPAVASRADRVLTLADGRIAQRR